MSDLKTLQEMCKSLGVTRRAVQGYEDAGLVTAAGRNKYGYLLYGEKEQNRIRKVKLYQQIGFTIREIKELIDAPDSIVKEAMEKQVTKLEEEHGKLSALIEEVKEIIRKLGEI